MHKTTSISTKHCIILHNASNLECPVSITFIREGHEYSLPRNADAYVINNVAFGTLCIRDQKFKIVTSNAYEKECSRLLNHVSSLNADGIKDLERLMNGTHPQAVHTLKEQVERIWLKHASKEEQVAHTKKTLETKCSHLKETYAKNLTILKTMEETLAQIAASKPSIDPFDIDFLTAFFNGNNSVVEDLCHQKLQNYLPVLADVCKRVITNKQHPFHSRIVDILISNTRFDDGTNRPTTHIKYLQDKGAFSDTLLIYAEVLPGIQQQKNTLEQKFTKEYSELRAQLDAL